MPLAGKSEKMGLRRHCVARFRKWSKRCKPVSLCYVGTHTHHHTACLLHYIMSVITHADNRSACLQYYMMNVITYPHHSSACLLHYNLYVITCFLHYIMHVIAEAHNQSWCLLCMSLHMNNTVRIETFENSFFKSPKLCLRLSSFMISRTRDNWERTNRGFRRNVRLFAIIPHSLWATWWNRALWST